MFPPTKAGTIATYIICVIIMTPLTVFIASLAGSALFIISLIAGPLVGIGTAFSIQQESHKAYQNRMNNLIIKANSGLPLTDLELHALDLYANYTSQLGG
jgi:uncharacterized protein YqfA (UPF0365 family)